MAQGVRAFALPIGWLVFPNEKGHHEQLETPD
jgi:hypothetical protein